jgi:2-dehydropantoate 2-reductase
MKIAILGAGAMGGLYGAYLSLHNQVTLIDVNADMVQKINENGLKVHTKNGETKIYRPNAAMPPYKGETADLVIVFTKSLHTYEALSRNKALLGDDTYILSLQNGSGHENIISQFADASRVLIGTTQHNADIPEAGVLNHKGYGPTYIGPIGGDTKAVSHIGDAFNACGLETILSRDVQKVVWNKLFTNVSISALTAVFQVPLGQISSNPHAWAICKRLIKEAVDVAAAMGMDFDYDQKVAEVKAIGDNNPAGLTSIYLDLKNGRKTEVDTISGSVVSAGQKYAVPTPNHCFVVDYIKAKEEI